MASPTMLAPEASRSTQECCRTAASTPSGIASNQVSNAAARESTSVFPSDSPSTVNTGCRRLNE
jgi:hypothetical protein